LWHRGPKASPGISAFVVKEDGAEAVSAATEKDRKDIFEGFVKGTVLAKEIGFEGVEFHGAHGYLLDSFLRFGHRSKRLRPEMPNLKPIRSVWMGLLLAVRQ
jgi:2,4-dienoyl-CoA reductase-like NADH-dependent reductase (Old Yellow Enzyme family)